MDETFYIRTNFWYKLNGFILIKRFEIGYKSILKRALSNRFCFNSGQFLIYLEFI